MQMELVVCGQRAMASDSAELRSGHERLRSQWPCPHWLTVPAEVGPEGLLAAALQQGAHLDGDAQVLLLAHGHWLTTDEAAQRLAAAVSEASPVALCWGGPYQPQAPAPNYHTVRGLERYCQAMAQQHTAMQATQITRLPQAPLIVARMQALRALGQHQAVAAAWVAGSYAHDFGSYQQGARPEVLRLVPATARRVLDIGGGEGQFLAALKAERGSQVETHLSEYSHEACARAAAQVDQTWPGDFLAQHWHGLTSAQARAGGGLFDCVTLLDSLEHTAEPQQWLARIHELLDSQGCLVGSVPNVGHWSVVADLLEGRWDYCPVGIHCITHLRFFTQRTLSDLLVQQGFALEHLEPVLLPCPANWRAHWLATPGLETGAAQLDTHAFLFRARPV